MISFYLNFFFSINLVILKYMSIAKKTLEFGNFNTLLAIVAALNLAAVSRLQRTWQVVEKQDKTALGVKQK